MPANLPQPEFSQVRRRRDSVLFPENFSNVLISRPSAPKLQAPPRQAPPPSAEQILPTWRWTQGSSRPACWFQRSRPTRKQNSRVKDHAHDKARPPGGVQAALMSSSSLNQPGLRKRRLAADIPAAYRLLYELERHPCSWEAQRFHPQSHRCGASGAATPKTT